MHFEPLESGVVRTTGSIAISPMNVLDFGNGRLSDRQCVTPIVMNR